MKFNLLSLKSETMGDKLFEYNKNIHNNLLDICNPLFKNLNISHFEYHKFFDDHSVFYISTNKKWHKFYIQNFANSSLIKSHLKEIYEENIKYYNLSLTSTTSKKGRFSSFVKEMTKFDMYNYFTIYVHYKNTMEAFSFATEKQEDSFINIYLNNLDRLYGFIGYFCDKGLDIISAANLEEFDNSKTGFFTRSHSSLSKQDKKMEEYLKATEITRYPILIDQETIYLTLRQAQCVHFLAKGRTYKEIGILLNVGPKCVENHLTFAKLKMKCKTNACLIKQFEQSSLLKKMDFNIMSEGN